ncbi:hypothetical protein KI387_017894, partial [Taxus chinensis]
GKWGEVDTTRKERCVVDVNTQGGGSVGMERDGGRGGGSGDDVEEALHSGRGREEVEQLCGN